MLRISRGLRLQLHPMPSLDLLRKHSIHHLMLLDGAEARKLWAHNVQPEHAPAATGYILDLHSRR